MSREMPSVPTEAPATPLEERLVAYLDGELDAQESRAVEELVSRDSQARAALERLERTWHLLDVLPRSEVGDGFTQSTLEMVTVAAEDDLRRQAAERPRRLVRRWLLGLASAAAAALAGYLAAATWIPDPNRALLEDLPVIEDLDEYRQIDDIEFLRLLHKEGLFSQEAADEG